jgi:(2Fe-2S) ferredoxin
MGCIMGSSSKGIWYANLIALAIARVVDRVALQNTGSNHRERRLFKN